ncbi:isoprenoid synthase domain-containing protein [Aspergillus aurantiobrunneus]
MADLASLGVSFIDVGGFGFQKFLYRYAPVLIKPTTTPTNWTPLCHPRAAELAKEVDIFFLENWDFPNAKSKQTFLKAGFSRAICLFFPLAKNDRLHLACRLSTILFLINDRLEEMSFEQGKAYNAKLMPIARGDVLPDRTVPVEFMLYDLWDAMRACDKGLADVVMESMFNFMRAQTDRVRKDIKDLKQYLEYRERDVGKGIASALMRFSMGLNLTPSELAAMKPLEKNCSKQFSVLNNVYSWGKESTGLGVEASKRVLLVMTREWERVHDEMVGGLEAGGCSQAVRTYVRGLEYQMSGNEYWSQTTLRYSSAE